MSTIIESDKWYNQLRNGLDFSLNQTDFTANIKGNVGDKVKRITTVLVDNSVDFDEDVDLNVEVFQAGGFGGSVKLKTTLGLPSSFTWEGLGLNIVQGSEIEIFSLGQVVVRGVVQSIGGTVMYLEALPTTIIDGTYQTGQIRNPEVIDELLWRYNLLRNISNQPSDYIQTDYFDVPNFEYWSNNVSPIGDGNPRSTLFVDLEAVRTEHWNSGSCKIRYVDEDEEWQQRFEIEQIFKIERVKDGDLGNAIPPNDPFKWGTLNYSFSLEQIIGNGYPNNVLITEEYVGNIGWYNENFNGGILDYSLDSISYTNLGNLEPIASIKANVITRVNSKILGVGFVVGQPVRICHTKIPQTFEVSDFKTNNTTYGRTYEEIWINEALVNGIGDASISGTIIKNLSITLVSANEIDIQYDVQYSNNANIDEGDEYLLYVGLENNALTSELSNKVNLIMDFNTYLRSVDEETLFYLDNYKIYNDLQEYSVDNPSTDYEGYVEDGVLLDFEFRLKTDITQNNIGNSARDWDDFKTSLVAYNLSDGTFFYISRQEDIDADSRNNALDGSWSYIRNWESDWKNYNFLLNSGNQFNKSQVSSPTFLQDIEYISNDGVYGTYRARIGIKINWQESIRLSENAYNRRVDSATQKSYMTSYLDKDQFGTGDVVSQYLWQDATQLNNGLNRKLSNYAKDNWVVRPLVEIDVDNIDGSKQTNFVNFMPIWRVYDYDTNSDYSAVSETFDVDDISLNKKLLINEPNRLKFTFDDGEVKSDIAQFEGIIRIEVKYQNSFKIYELSTHRDTFDNNILKGYGLGGLLVEKSIEGGKYVMNCLVDGNELVSPSYKITGRIWDAEVLYNPEIDTDLDGWYDATGMIVGTNNSYGILTALGEVTVWKNLKADSNYDFFQGTLTKRPIFSDVLKQVQFSFPTDYMYWTDNDLGSQFTIFAVVEGKNTLLHNNVMYLNDGNNNVDDNSIDIYDDVPNATNPQLFVDSYQGVSDVSVEEGAITRVDSEKYVRQVTCNFGGDWYVKVNNVRYDAPDDIQNTPIIGGNNVFGIGAKVKKTGGVNVVGQEVRDGYFHEILIFANVDVSFKETAINNYLKNKWGIV